MDINGITTPINVNRLEELLIESKYNEEDTKFLVKGFREGFSIEYHGPISRQDTSNNIPLRVGNKKGTCGEK